MHTDQQMHDEREVSGMEKLENEDKNGKEIKSSGKNIIFWALNISIKC